MQKPLPRRSRFPTLLLRGASSSCGGETPAGLWGLLWDSPDPAPSPCLHPTAWVISRLPGAGPATSGMLRVTGGRGDTGQGQPSSTRGIARGRAPSSPGREGPGQGLRTERGAGATGGLCGRGPVAGNLPPPQGCPGPPQASPRFPRPLTPSRPRLPQGLGAKSCSRPPAASPGQGGSCTGQREPRVGLLEDLPCCLALGGPLHTFPGDGGGSWGRQGGRKQRDSERGQPARGLQPQWRPSAGSRCGAWRSSGPGLLTYRVLPPVSLTALLFRRAPLSPENNPWVSAGRLPWARRAPAQQTRTPGRGSWSSRGRSGPGPKPGV